MSDEFQPGGFVEAHRLLAIGEAREDVPVELRRLVFEAMDYMWTMGDALFQIIKDGGHQADRARVALMAVYGPDAFERWQAAEDKREEAA